MFDSINGRTCLHFASYYGHSDCLQAILLAARSAPLADSWGFARFVNVRDGNGATPLHLAARRRRPDCIRILLNNGALVRSTTADNGSCPGSTALHLAARSGCLNSVRELLSWGADRLQRDSSGRTPHAVALERNHGACAALLNPLSAGPLLWPAPLKFIGKLDPAAKVLLEAALREANRAREETILKDSSTTTPELSDEVGDDDEGGESSEICRICFDQACSIEVRDCGHRMCARCVPALCCGSKPSPATGRFASPACPFCRRDIMSLAVAVPPPAPELFKEEEEEENFLAVKNS